MLCSLAERLRGALVRAGDIAVEGHCDIESKFCHGHSVRAFALKWSLPADQRPCYFSSSVISSRESWRMKDESHPRREAAPRSNKG